MIVGDIVYFSNIIFEKAYYNDENVILVDHCSHNGRPCIYLGQIDDKMYFIPITGNNKYSDMGVCINVTKSNRLLKPSYLVLNNIICKESSYYYTKGFINEHVMYDLFKKFIDYYEEFNYCLRTFPNIGKVYELAIEYVDCYERPVVKHKKKRCKKKG